MAKASPFPDYSEKVIEAVKRLFELCHESKWNTLSIYNCEYEPKVDFWYGGERINPPRPTDEDADWSFLGCCQTAISMAELIGNKNIS